jgi:Zn-dependent peptidase ImmA (M78 family)
LEDHLFGYKLAIFDEIEDASIEAYTDFERRAIFVPLKTYDALIRGHHNNRERFTTTHEAGHVILHRKYFENKALVAARTGYGKIKPYMDPEWQANAAAGALLMPLTTFYWENKRLEAMGYSSFSRVLALASQFQVSEDAVERRLKTLENEGIKDLIRRFDHTKKPSVLPYQGLHVGSES